MHAKALRQEKDWYVEKKKMKKIKVLGIYPESRGGGGGERG